MTVETVHDAHSPSFAAPMDPARYTRRLYLEPHQLVERVTPQRDLFVLAHLGIPHVDAGAWRLAVAGLVERPTTLTLDELRRLPAREVESFHQCAGAPRRPDLAARRVANVVWRGVDLAELLAGCGVAPAAKFLWAYGLDHGRYEELSAKWYVKDLPLSRLDEGGVILAYAVNGEPLAPEHGFPLRLIVPGYYGTNTVKWLWRLELAASRAAGPFTTVLYNDPNPAAGTRPVWEAPPESLIVAPKSGPLSGPLPAAAPVARFADHAAGRPRRPGGRGRLPFGQPFHHRPGARAVPRARADQAALRRLVMGARRRRRRARRAGDQRVGHHLPGARATRLPQDRRHHLHDRLHVSRWHRRGRRRQIHERPAARPD